ncbi:MAG: heme lyase NrfEFG subunit NrfE, partial [Rhodospirillaceae bacterium]|nr:heme lyase NrfEFG subunit NrfE [Rhodospirillaceae bacterium]
RSQWGMSIAHAGLGIAIIGMVGSTVWKQEKIIVMHPGETVQVAGYDYTFVGARQLQGPNYIATRGKFIVNKGDKHITNLYPEDRAYPVRSMPTTEAAIYTMASADLYVALGNKEKNSDGYVVRIYHNPLVVWIWVGVLQLVLGATISLSDRRHRVGAPERASRPGKATVPQATK